MLPPTSHLRSIAICLGALIIPALALIAFLIGSAPAAALQQQPAIPFESLPADARVETVLDGMHQPVAIAFDPNGRIFYTERDTGNIRLFANGQLQDSPVITFKVDSFDEHGLLGITVDPDFQNNHYVYTYFICGVSDDCPVPESRLVRFVEHDGVGSDPQIIFSSASSSSKHVSGGVHFGPDGKLYVTVGDNLNPANSQDLTVKNGKLLRLNPDGTLPDDNPHFDQEGALGSIYAIGLRNTFDYTFDPYVPGRIYGAENGPNCDDELNRIEPGYNYGWRPDYPCDDSDPNGPNPNFNSIPPLFYLGQGSCCDAPTGVAVYTGDQIPEWKGQLFMSSYNNGALYHFTLDSTRTAIVSQALVRDVKANVTISMGPDGALYYVEMGGKQDGILKRIVAATQPAPTDVAGTATPVSTKSATPQPTVIATVPGDESKTFSETDKTVNGIFLDYWQQHGGLIQQGYPISAPMSELSSLDGKSYAVQYFERAVFEYHPEITDPQYKVLLSQLGTYQYKQKYPDGAPNQLASTSPDTILFPETGKHLGGRFLAYWNEHGGLAQQGYPISEEFTEISPLNGKPYTVQYFERAVLEYHPENAGTDYEVLLSQLGTFRYQQVYAGQ